MPKSHVCFVASCFSFSFTIYLHAGDSRKKRSLKRNNVSFLENKSIGSQRPHMPLNDVLIEKIPRLSVDFVYYCDSMHTSDPAETFESNLSWFRTLTVHDAVMLDCHETVWISCLHYKAHTLPHAVVQSKKQNGSSVVTTDHKTTIIWLNLQWQSQPHLTTSISSKTWLRLM